VAMDYCLLEDAFKGSSDISNTMIGCTDNTGSSKQQKHEKKKKQRTKDCFNPQAHDSEVNNHPAQEAKQYSEAFQNAPVKVPNIPSVLGNNKLPSYFLGNDDDGSNIQGTGIEGFVGDFDKAKVEMGFEKASGESNQLPLPSIDDNWKPLTPATSNTAYFSSLPTPGGTYPIWNKLNYEPRKFNESDANANTNDTNGKVSGYDNSNLQYKIDELMKRLDDLEKEYNTPHLNNQQEILAFVGTGVFMIFTLSLLRC